MGEETLLDKAAHLGVSLAEAAQSVRMARLAIVQGVGLASLSDLRPAIEDAVDRLIGVLDLLDGDADYEPSLGSPSSVAGSASNQARWAEGSSDDHEIDEGEAEP